MDGQSDRDGGPVFPIDLHTSYVLKGMTLRQWYAGMAMQAIMQVQNEPLGISYNKHSYASSAFDMADAMLEHERVGR